MMRILSNKDVSSSLNWDDVFAALSDAFLQKDEYFTPDRVVVSTSNDRSFLAMPCLSSEGYFGVKQVSVVPENIGRGLPTVQSWYTLMDPKGRTILSAEADFLTCIRTAAVSALAAYYLAYPRDSALLVIGTGALAPWMAEAHAHLRKYTRILVWGRDGESAERTATEVRLRLPNVTVNTTANLEWATRSVSVVTCATSAKEPVIRGAWLDPIHHVDIVGSFTPTMQEVDADAVVGSDVVVDDRHAVQAEAGDLISAQSRGWKFAKIRADLAEVIKGDFVRGEKTTLFKSVGLAIEDLVLALLLMGR